MSFLKNNDKFIKVDNHSFNVTLHAGKTEAEFVKDKLPSVQDVYGDDEVKKAFLKDVYAKIQSAAPKPDGEEDKSKAAKKA